MEQDRPADFDDGTDDLPRWRKIVPWVLALIFAIALAFLIQRADHASEQRDRAIALQRHSYQVMLRAATIEAKVGNAEALLARYVISHDTAVGRQFEEEWDSAGRERVALERSTRNDPDQTRSVAALREAMAEREKTLKEIALRVRYEQSLGALGQLEATRKEPSVEAIAQRLREISAHAEAQRARHDLQVTRTKAQANRLNEGYGVIGLGMLVAAVGALWFANSAINERTYARRLAAAEAARVDDLEVAVQRRTEQLRRAHEKLYKEMEERIAAEQSLRQLQKMEALGQLTGGIAHDFNNMLAVVVGGIDIARRQLNKNPDKAALHLDSAIEGANHAAALIERLLAFARAEPLLPDRIPVDQLIADTRDLIARATGSGVKVELDLQAGDWQLWADRAQLESALINMAVNARDAMDGRGTLRISTARMALNQNEIGNCPAGEYICLTVSDTGAGIPADILERVFEPFFTTKAVGKGTGLGMSQIFGFVTQCRGTIDVSSIENEGTTLRLILPRLTESANPGSAGRRQAPEESILPSTEPLEEVALTILLVEDDPRVLRSTLATVTALGHTGIACDHPEKAGEVLAAHPEIDLILSDVLMPSMSGPEMIEAHRELIGDRPVIFVTGFAGDKAAATQTGNHPVLRKPFTITSLANALEDAMRLQREQKSPSEIV